MAKSSITTIQVNLVPNASETWRRQHKFTLIVVIRFLPLAYYHSHFLVATLAFFTMAFLGHMLFSQVGCFGLDFLILHLLKQLAIAYLISRLSFFTSAFLQHASITIAFLTEVTTDNTRANTW